MLQVLDWIPIEIDPVQHLLNWHKNGSTFDLNLDYQTTHEMLRIMHDAQPANRK